MRAAVQLGWWGFIAGFFATLTAHQFVIAGFHAAGLFGSAAWNTSPVPPFGVPSVLSLAFFGGLWGIVLAALIWRLQGLRYWLAALLVGSIGPTAVALLVVLPLKGVSLGTFEPRLVAGGLIVNAAWGLTTALLLRWALQRGAAGQSVAV